MSHTVMVTGADGFIGSHLAEELVKSGEKVRAFCLYNSFGSLGWIDTLPPEIRNEMDIFMGDVRDPNGVRTAMRGQERVFHLAALIAIPFSYHSPDSYANRVLVMSKAKVAMYDTVEKVFARAPELLELGLSVPQVTQVFLMLKAMGMEIDTDVYTVPYAVKTVLKAWNAKHPDKAVPLP